MTSIFSKFKKMFVAVLVTVAVVLGLSACDARVEPTVTMDEADSVSVIETLNSADKIHAKKAVFSWGDSWEIYADDVLVGEVRGVPIYLIGDTYSLFSVDGNLVGSESENFRIVNATADLYDYNNEKVGRIEQEISLLFMKLRVFQGDVKVGTVHQEFGFSLNASIDNMNGDDEWKIDRAVFSFGASVTVTREANETDVDGINALWTALMMNEIYEAQQAKNAESNNN